MPPIFGNITTSLLISDLYGELVPDSPLDKLLSGAVVFDRLDGFELNYYRSNMTKDPFLRAWEQQGQTQVRKLNELVPLSWLAADPEYFQVVKPSRGSSFVYDSVMAIGFGGCTKQRLDREAVWSPIDDPDAPPVDLDLGPEFLPVRDPGLVQSLNATSDGLAQDDLQELDSTGSEHPDGVNSTSTDATASPPSQSRTEDRLPENSTDASGSNVPVPIGSPLKYNSGEPSLIPNAIRHTPATAPMISLESAMVSSTPSTELVRFSPDNVDSPTTARPASPLMPVMSPSIDPPLFLTPAPIVTVGTKSSDVPALPIYGSIPPAVQTYGPDQKAPGQTVAEAPGIGKIPILQQSPSVAVGTAPTSGITAPDPGPNGEPSVTGMMPKANELGPVKPPEAFPDAPVVGSQLTPQLPLVPPVGPVSPLVTAPVAPPVPFEAPLIASPVVRPVVSAPGERPVATPIAPLVAPIILPPATAPFPPVSPKELPVTPPAALTVDPPAVPSELPLVPQAQYPVARSGIPQSFAPLKAPTIPQMGPPVAPSMASPVDPPVVSPLPTPIYPILAPLMAPAAESPVAPTAAPPTKAPQVASPVASPVMPTYAPVVDREVTFSAMPIVAQPVTDTVAPVVAIAVAPTEEHSLDPMAAPTALPLVTPPVAPPLLQSKAPQVEVHVAPSMLPSAALPVHPPVALPVVPLTAPVNFPVAPPAVILPAVPTVGTPVWLPSAPPFTAADQSQTPLVHSSFPSKSPALRNYPVALIGPSRAPSIASNIAFSDEPTLKHSDTPALALGHSAAPSKVHSRTPQREPNHRRSKAAQ